jgi:hypothetical protein
VYDFITNQGIPFSSTKEVGVAAAGYLAGNAVKRGAHRATHSWRSFGASRRGDMKRSEYYKRKVQDRKGR